MVTMGQIIDTNYILNITEPFLNHFFHGEKHGFQAEPLPVFYGV
jgi:hypothetical protein